MALRPAAIFGRHHLARTIKAELVYAGRQFLHNSAYITAISEGKLPDLNSPRRHDAPRHKSKPGNSHQHVSQDRANRPYQSRPKQDVIWHGTRTVLNPTSPLQPYNSGHRKRRRIELIDGQLSVPSSKGNWDPIPDKWLRDMCPCSQCRNQETKQRQVNVFRMPDEAFQTESVRSVSIDGVQCFEVVFKDGHQSTFTDELFNGRTHFASLQQAGYVEVKTWDAGISDEPPTVSWHEVQEGPGMAALLQKVREYGFAFVDSVPPTPEATESLLRSIGPIRETHYGGFYDFTSDLSSRDTAYTSEALEPHTDNTYFTEPAGLQALHLLSHTDGSGGESSLVDGFAAAEQLFRSDFKAYRRLNTTGVHAHASGNEGIGILPAQPYPTFTHHSSLRHLMQVRWNNADRAGVATSTRTLDDWYEAAGKFDALVNDRKNQYWFQLKPGKMLLFDNWRVLHGRSAFTGKRRMCGGYINRDDFISKYRMTNLSKEEIEVSTVTG